MIPYGLKNYSTTALNPMLKDSEKNVEQPNLASITLGTCTFSRRFMNRGTMAALSHPCYFHWTCRNHPRVSHYSKSRIFVSVRPFKMQQTFSVCQIPYIFLRKFPYCECFLKYLQELDSSLRLLSQIHD